MANGNEYASTVDKGIVAGEVDGYIDTGSYLLVKNKSINIKLFGY